MNVAAMTSQRKGLMKNVLSLGVVQVANYLLPLISVPVISRIIGPEKFGILNFAAAFIAYFNIIITYSFDFTATRRILKDPNNVQNRSLVFSEVFWTQCLLFFLSTFLFLLLIFLVPEFRSMKTVMLYSYTLCVSALFTQNWMFQAMQQLSKVALLNLVSKVVFTIAVLVVIREESDYVWHPFLFGAAQVGIALFSFFWAIKKFEISLLRVTFKRCMQVLFEDRIIFLSLIFVSLYTYTNIFILGLMQNAEQVGYFTAAQRLILIAQTILSMPLAQAFYPFIGRAFAESRESGLRIAQKLFSIIIIFIGLASVVMMIGGPIVIRLFYGSKFENAVPVFLILALVPLLFTLNNVLGVQIMVNLGMDKTFLKINAVAGIVSILLNLAMIRKWGHVGTALNCIITEILLLVTMYVVLKKRNLNPFNQEFFTCAAISEYLEPFRRRFSSKS